MMFTPQPKPLFEDYENPGTTDRPERPNQSKIVPAETAQVAAQAMQIAALRSTVFYLMNAVSAHLTGDLDTAEEAVKRGMVFLKGIAD